VLKLTLAGHPESVSVQRQFWVDSAKNSQNRGLLYLHFYPICYTPSS
jgi:hypothetical protein